MKNMMDLMKQAKNLQNKMQEMQKDIEEIQCKGLSGGGMVEITLSGQNHLKEIKIDPSLLKESEIEILEDLIVAAHHDAREKVKQEIEQKTQKIGENFSLGNSFKFPF